MRSFATRLVILAAAASAVASCDSRSPTSAESQGQLGIEIPRLAAEGTFAAQVNTDVGRINVQVRNTGTSVVIFNQDFGAADLENATTTGSVSGTLRVTMPLPGDAATATFELRVEVYNGAGQLLFTMGPTSFTFGSGGSVQLQVAPVYVGPGAGVTGVRLEPQSLTMLEGEQRTVTCFGTPGDVTLFPFRIESANAGIARVTGNSVAAQGPGTTQVRCTLLVDPGATADIQVTVNPRPGTLNVLSGGGQTAAAGAALAAPIRFEVRGTNGLPMAGQRVQIAVTAGGGMVSSSEVTTATDGTGQVTWTLGSQVGQQSIQLTVPGTTLSQTVNATATQPQGATIAGTTRNAQSGEALSGVAVELRAGTNVTTGPTVATAVSNASGNFTFSGVPAGPYTLRGTASGFAQAIVLVTVPTSGTVSATLSLSPLLAAGQVRIVLSWGPTPPDLDAHLAVPNVGVVYFAQPGSTGAPFFASLDADQVSGFGPETITIHQLLSGTYTFYVHDFTNFSGAFTALSQSGARVDVYVGASPVANFTFTPPQQPGVLWTVFNLSSTGGGNVSVTAVGTISTVGPFGLRAGVQTDNVSLLRKYSYELKSPAGRR